MKPGNRAQNVAIVATVVFVFMGLTAAHAQTAAWPARPVRILVPYTPGGGVDFVARALSTKLTELHNGSFIVENRPGGTGVIAGEQLVRAAPDGYTLMASALEFAINPAIRPKLPYDPIRDFTHISQLASVQMMLVSHPSVPIKGVRQVLDAARAQPGKLTYGSSGTGGGPHLSGELLQLMSGIKWTHVPFKGAAPAAIAVISGEVDFSFGSTNALVGHVKSGRVRALGVTGSKRSPILPGVPTIAEGGVPGYESIGWYGYYGPPNMPAELLRRIHAESVRALRSPDVVERMERAGNEVVASAPDEFLPFVRSEIAKWARVVKESKLKVD